MCCTFQRASQQLNSTDMMCKRRRAWSLQVHFHNDSADAAIALDKRCTRSEEPPSPQSALKHTIQFHWHQHLILRRRCRRRARNRRQQHTFIRRGLSRRRSRSSRSR